MGTGPAGSGATSVVGLVRQPNGPEVDHDDALVAELRAFQAVTDAVLAHSSDLVMFFAPDGEICWVSPPAAKIFGIEPDALLGERGYDLVHHDDRDQVVRDFTSLGSVGDSIRSEFRIVIDDAVRWVEVIFTDLLDEPNVGRIVGNVRDVTERRAAAEALLFHDTLLAAAAQAIVAVGGDERVLYWNAAAEALYGWSADEAMGQVLRRLVPLAERSAPLPADLVEVFGTGSWEGELRVVAKSGRTVPILARSRPVFDVSGAFIAVTVVSSDLTQQLEARETTARLSAIVESSNDAIFSVDPVGRIATWNDGAARLYGLSARHAVGQHLSLLDPPDGERRLWRCFEQVRREDEASASVTMSLGEAEDRRYIAVSMSAIRPNAGRLIGVSMIAQDVTERVERRQRDDEARRRLAEAQASAHLGSFEIDLDTGAVLRSEELWRIIGREPGSLVGVDFDHIHPDDRAEVRAALEAASCVDAPDVSCTHRVVRPDGSVRWVLSRTRSMDAGVSRVVAGTMLDITERHEAEQALAHQAHHDPLTGLANRRLLVERVGRSLERNTGAATTTALLYLDLDDFKAVNDRLGHVDADGVLRVLAERISACTDPDDTVARLGGDEFVVCCDRVRDTDDLWERAERVRSTLRDPFEHAGTALTITASVGVACSLDGSTAEDLLRNADAALYDAKERGRGLIVLFDDALDAAVRRRVQLTADLGPALDEDQFHTHFQPEVELATGRLIGFEALARWHHPIHGAISPAEFIDLAERNRSIGRLGQKVLADACTALATWIDRCPEQRLSVAVNVSPLQLADPAFPDHVRAAVRGAGVPPGRLCLEVTESTLMDSEAATMALRELKAIGVTIAIDDFGTGYSSLSRLKRFPVDILKVDQTFVSGLGFDPEDEVIVATVIKLARLLGLDVVAEGVETTAQMEVLAQLGCERAQGYLWSLPLDLDAATRYATESEALRHAESIGSGAALAGGQAAFADEVEAASTMAAIVHELAAPLTVIRGYADLARYLPAPDDGEMLDVALGAIGRSADDMATIMQTMKDVRRIEEGTLVLERRPLDVTQLLSEIIAERAMGDSSNPVALGVDHPVEVLGDGTRCRQIFINLLTNAATWSPSGAPVEIRVEVAETTASVSIVDQGPGVSAERVGDLFRMFARPDRSRKGTGLGLYVARSLARAQGGDIRYRRAVGGGSEFIVDLPRPPIT